MIVNEWWENVAGLHSTAAWKLGWIVVQLYSSELKEKQTVGELKSPSQYCQDIDPPRFCLSGTVAPER